MTELATNVLFYGHNLDILRRLTNRFCMAAALLILVCSCAQATPAAGSPSPLASGPGAAAGDLCGRFGGRIVGPDGENVDLTGTWQLSGTLVGSPNGPLYFVSQTGVCVSMAGGFPANQNMADAFRSPWGGATEVFLGEIDETFVVTGRFAVVRHSATSEPELDFFGGPIQYGTREWDVRFVEGRPTELRSVYTGEPDVGGSLTLIKLSDRFLEPLNP